MLGLGKGERKRKGEKKKRLPWPTSWKGGRKWRSAGKSRDQGKRGKKDKGHHEGRRVSPQGKRAEGENARGWSLPDEWTKKKGKREGEGRGPIGCGPLKKKKEGLQVWAKSEKGKGGETLLNGLTVAGKGLYLPGGGRRGEKEGKEKEPPSILSQCFAGVGRLRRLYKSAGVGGRKGKGGVSGHRGRLRLGEGGRVQGRRSGGGFSFSRKGKGGGGKERGEGLSVPGGPHAGGGEVTAARSISGEKEREKDDAELSVGPSVIQEDQPGGGGGGED